jgi:hypothetical protein
MVMEQRNYIAGHSTSTPRSARKDYSELVGPEFVVLLGAISDTVHGNHERREPEIHANGSGNLTANADNIKFHNSSLGGRRFRRNTPMVRQPHATFVRLADQLRIPVVLEYQCGQVECRPHQPQRVL